MKLGDTIPNFSAVTDRGSIDKFYDWVGDGSWAMIFSHPADFTPVCTTELAQLMILAEEFTARNVKIMAISVDTAETHREWAKDIVAYTTKRMTPEDQRNELPYEIVADADRSLCLSLGMIDPEELNAEGVPVSCRAVLLIGPDRKLKAQILYPATVGRNFQEILRLIDGIQLATQLPVATPVNWVQGDPVVAQPSLTDEEVISKVCNGDPSKLTLEKVPSGKNYMRYIKGLQINQ